MSSPINIRQLKEDEHDFILQAFDDWYFPYEPLTNGFRLTRPSQGEKLFFNSALNEGLTLVATLPEEGDKIVGFLVNTPGNRKLQHFHVNEDGEDERHNAFLGFVKAMESQQNILSKFDEQKIYKLLALAVDPLVRGNDIGFKLFKRALVMAKDLNYSIARAFCTSKFSIRIAERHKMTPIASIEYKEYKDLEGNQVFEPSLEHTHATLFVKVLI